MENFSKKTGQDLGVLVDSPYLFFVVDLVEAELPDGSKFEYTYLRVIYKQQLDGGVNVAVVGTIVDPTLGPPGAVILVKQERHSTGKFHLEIPRGFGEEGLSGEENALREFSQETGFAGQSATFLGETYTDTGLTDSHVSFYHVSAVGRDVAHPDTQEALGGVVIMPKGDLQEEIRAGSINDAFTLQGLALLDLA